MDLKSPSRNYLLKPAAASAIAGGAAYMWRGNAPVLIPGAGTVSFPLLVAGGTFVASEVAALINDYLFPHIPVINAVQAPMHTALNVGAVAAVTAGVENFYSPGLSSEQGLGEIGMLAAAAEVGSTYICDEWLIPMYNQWTGNGYH
jgi:hypothetical protein